MIQIVIFSEGVFFMDEWCHEEDLAGTIRYYETQGYEVRMAEELAA